MRLTRWTKTTRNIDLTGNKMGMEKSIVTWNNDICLGKRWTTISCEVDPTIVHHWARMVVQWGPSQGISIHKTWHGLSKHVGNKKSSSSQSIFFLLAIKWAFPQFQSKPKLNAMGSQPLPAKLLDKWICASNNRAWASSDMLLTLALQSTFLFVKYMGYQNKQEHYSRRFLGGIKQIVFLRVFLHGRGSNNPLQLPFLWEYEA